MSLVAGDVVEITLHATFNGVAGVNRFHYLLGGADASATLAGDAFETFVLPVLGQLVSTGMNFNKIVCKNLFDVLEVDERTVDLDGSQPSGGEDMSPFTAWPFRLLHTDANVRAGGKRFMGVTEGQSTNGKTPALVMIATMSAIESILASDLDIGGGLSALLPVVVGLLDDGLGGYDLPETQAELLGRGFGFITDAVVGYISSQNSRKVYQSD